MMSVDDNCIPPKTADTQYFNFAIDAGRTVESTFNFTTLSMPDMRLTFPPRPPPRPRKRSRAVADIDGEHSCMQKKKRRLRLFLITSRLSPQFSHPATNIVDRGSSKIAVWAKQKSLGRNLLRKAAILNGIRLQALPMKETARCYAHLPCGDQKEQDEMALAKLEFHYGSVDTYTRPVTSRHPSVPPSAAVRTGGRFVVSGSPTGSPNSSRRPSPTPPSTPPKPTQNEMHTEYRSPNEAYVHVLPRAQIPRREYIPLPPSPLGLSNYDAFDVDDDMPDPYSHLDDNEGEPSRYMFDEEEDDADSVPFSPSAVTCTSSSTLQTQASQVLKTPTQIKPPDFNVLDHNEPVLGDYDLVDDGENAVWPRSFVQEIPTTTSGSTSPDFNALFATAPPAKRSDSFASPSGFRHTQPKTSTSPQSPPTASTSPNFPPTTSFASPNFAPSTAAASSSRNFAHCIALTSTSPNSASAVLAATPSPNFAALASSVAITASPNFRPVDAPAIQPHARRMSLPHEPRPNDRTRRNSAVVDHERNTQ